VGEQAPPEKSGGARPVRPPGSATYDGRVIVPPVPAQLLPPGSLMTNLCSWLHIVL